MDDLREAMRRVVTGDDEQGKSVIIIDAGPSSSFGEPDLGGLFEIWEEAASGMLDPRETQDRGAAKPKLGPREGNFQVRWFVVQPLPDGVAREALNAAVSERFAEVGAAEYIIDQSRHPAMHETRTIDVICLLRGKAKLILEDAETLLTPGQVVIQRGTNHAWEAIDGPALFLAVLVDRPLRS
jgi:quercetin dioxygenase-like cupin family protein